MYGLTSIGQIVHLAEDTIIDIVDMVIKLVRLNIQNVRGGSTNTNPYWPTNSNGNFLLEIF